MSLLYGNRFIDSKQFVAYCRQIKADPNLQSSDLEFYEKENMLLPVARIVQPQEYVILRRKQYDPGGDPGVSIPGWEKLEKLLFGASNIDLWNKFDWEFENNNEYLIRPSRASYRAWDSYKVEVSGASGGKFFAGNVNHYYHYWQVYQVYEIQSKYPIFSKYRAAFEVLEKYDPNKGYFYYPGDPNHIVDFYGYYSFFDALSFFIEFRANEDAETFFLPNGRIRRLSDDDIKKYKLRLKGHAEFVIRRFQLSTDDLYKFLGYLLTLQSQYQDHEKIMLSKEIEKDLVNLFWFLSYASGQSFEDVQAGLNQKQKQFRHLDKSLLVRDQTSEVFNYHIKQYNKLFPSSRLSDQELEQLLDFLFSNSLFIFPYAVHEIDKNLNEGKPFPQTSLYVSLSNLSVGFESFLKIVGVTKLTAQSKKLYHYIRDLFHDERTWWNQFQSKCGGDSTIERIYDTVTDPTLYPTAKIFLTTLTMSH